MARSLRMVNTVVFDGTKPVEQKGFNALAIVDCTSIVAKQMIYSVSDLTPGTDLYKGASKAFANGMTSIWVVGVGEAGTIDEVVLANTITELAEENGVYNFTFILPYQEQAALISGISETINATKTMCVTEINGDAADVLAMIQSTNSDRMAFVCVADPLFSGDACALFAYGAKFTPGTMTYSNKAIDMVGLSGYTNADNQLILDGNGIVFTKEKGLILSRQSNTSGGSFIDITTSTDYMVARTEEALVFRFANSKKLAYTNRDINLIRTAMTEPANTFVADNILASYEILLPSANEVPVNDKANRVLNGVRLVATLAGSIETITLEFEVKL